MKNLQLKSGLLCVLSIVSAPVIATDDETKDMPSLEFLEFLGSFEDNSGQWQDPFEIDDDDETNPIEIDTQQGEKQ
ncbi:MAG TPA: hypothetical protein ENJ07_03115 [Gammaproteobacteria bacterium]|nr:hypothetical protein [Gammaproteobacteria bacterium]